MIAFYKQTTEPRTTPGMRRARRLIASTLFKEQPARLDVAPKVAGWKAWVFTSWVVVTVVVYFAYMLELF